MISVYLFFALLSQSVDSMLNFSCPVCFNNDFINLKTMSLLLINLCTFLVTTIHWVCHVVDEESHNLGLKSLIIM